MDWSKIKYRLKWFIIKTNLFKHTFTAKGFVYLDKFRNPTNDVTITTDVDWLGTVDVKCRYKDFYDVAIEAFDNMYPRYRGYINLY